MKSFLLFGSMLFLFVFGCCCALTPDSSSSSSNSGSCPYGTYGSACSYACSIAGVGGNCFSECMDGVEAEGLGDATTCCSGTFRQECDSLCDSLALNTGSSEAGTECMDECLGTYEYVGIDVDSCYIPL